MFLVDTHTHLYLEQFDADRDEVVQSALEAGVKYMLLPNIDRDSLVPMKNLNNQYPEYCLPMMGLHPTSVKENYENELLTVENELKSGLYVAVGEIGIDLYWDQTFRDQQEDALRKQLNLAKKFKLPVSIHTRESFDLIYRIVSEESTDDLRGVFHCFTGTLKESELIRDVGFKMGVGGIVTIKNAGVAEVVREIPLTEILLETDAPYLTPAPHRGKRNQSSYLTHIAKKLAELKETSVTEIGEVTSRNALDLFKFSSDN